MFLYFLMASNIFFFKFLKYLSGTDPKVHRSGDKEHFIPFLKVRNKPQEKYLKIYKRQDLGKKSNIYSLS